MEKTARLSDLFVRLLLVAFIIIVALTVFEFIKNLLFPHLSLWPSQIITIVFISAIGTIVAYFILKKYFSLLTQLNKNLVDRQQSEQVLINGYASLEELVDKRTTDLVKANEALRSEFLEHQHDAEALRFSEAQSRVLAEEANSIILRLNTKGQVTFFNKFAQSFFGYSEDEICGYSVIGTIVPETDTSGRNLTAMITDLVTHPDRYTINENENIKRNGERVWISWSNKAILDDYGQVIEILCIGNEKTALKLEEERFGRQHKLDLLQKSLEEITVALSSSMEKKFPHITGHQKRVAQLACDIAREIDLSEKQIDRLRTSSILHDIGMIYMPTEILTKPATLTEIEYLMIKVHPQVGYEILKGIEFPWPVAEIVLQHHERLDGSGYPKGLSGWDILLPARILAVADVVAAMTSHRPYRPGLGIEMALEELTKNQGILYDEHIADACIKLFTVRGFKFEVFPGLEWVR
jgi:PAS domain S-box-containing protein/putative nucleotidyltransferase with HDIG domain